MKKNKNDMVVAENAYLREIKNNIEAAELEFFVDTDNTGTTFVIDFNSLGRVELNIFLTFRNQDVIDIRSYITTDDYGVDSHRVLPVLNDLNNSNRFVKFVLDGEGRIFVDYSLMVYGKPELFATNVMKVLLFIMCILNDSVPQIMQCLDKRQ